MNSKELSEAAEELYHALVVEGESESDAAEIFGWDSETYARVKNKLLETKSSDLRGRPRDYTYAEYVIEQKKNIRDLDDVLIKLDGIKMHAAAIGAIRLRHDIQNKIIEKGQEFGVIKKEPDKKQIVAGVMVADMSKSELSSAIGAELTGMKSMLEEFGDKNIIDTMSDDASLHYGEATRVAEIESVSDSTNEEKRKPKEVEKRKPKEVEKIKPKEVEKKKKKRGDHGT